MQLWGTISVHVWVALGAWSLYLVYRRLEAISGALVMQETILRKLGEAQLGDVVGTRAHNEEKLELLKADLLDAIRKLREDPGRN